MTSTGVLVVCKTIIDPITPNLTECQEFSWPIFSCDRGSSKLQFLLVQSDFPKAHMMFYMGNYLLELHMAATTACGANVAFSKHTAHCSIGR